MNTTVIDFAPRSAPVSTIPFERDTQEHSEALRALYRDHVVATGKDGHWKGPCMAKVPAELANDVRDAMNFMGSLVDSERELVSGMVVLRSRGYWSHGF